MFENETTKTYGEVLRELGYNYPRTDAAGNPHPVTTSSAGGEGVTAKPMPLALAEAFIRGYRASSKGKTLPIAGEHVFKEKKGKQVNTVIYAPSGSYQTELNATVKGFQDAAKSMRASGADRATAMRVAASAMEEYGSIMGELAANWPHSISPKPQLWRSVAGIIDGIKPWFREAREGGAPTEGITPSVGGIPRVTQDLLLRVPKEWLHAGGPSITLTVNDAHKMADALIETIGQEPTGERAKALIGRHTILIGASLGARGRKVPDAVRAALAARREPMIVTTFEAAYMPPGSGGGPAKPEAPSLKPTARKRNWANAWKKG